MTAGAGLPTASYHALTARRPQRILGCMSSLDPNQPERSKPRTPQTSRAKPRGIAKTRDDRNLTARERMVARLAFQGYAAKEIAEQLNLTPTRVSQLIVKPGVVAEVNRLQAEADKELIHTVRARALKMQEAVYAEFESTFNKLKDLRDNGTPRDGIQMQATKFILDKLFDINVIPATTRARLATEAANAKNQPPTLNIYVTQPEKQGLDDAVNEALELAPELDYRHEDPDDAANDETQNVGTSSSDADV